jgi:hypothetical protein
VALSRRESQAARAEAIIAEELRRTGWKETEFKERPKNDAAKRTLGARLRRETTLTISEIAQRLHMGGRKSFSSQLHQRRKTNEKHT